MSFGKIGTGLSGTPLVLSEFNETERVALALILNLAVKHLDDLPMPKLRGRRGITESMISELRRVHEIED
jgi:hypothetical protein